MLKGILLAGGSGTRLFPLTRGISKQLTPIYDKPMIYYPLSTLMLSGIRDIAIITTPHEQDSFRRLLGDGRDIGMQLTYLAQPHPGGIAEAFLIAREFIGSDRVALALGDNLFYGHGLPAVLRQAAARPSGATIFAYSVKDPERYGVVEFDAAGKPIGLLEKPAVAPSPYAVTGLYFYDNQVIGIAERLQRSPRGELEITDVNRVYLEAGTLAVERLGRGFAWLDTGTHAALLQASNFIYALEERTGLKVACIEEIAYRLGYIGAADVLRLGRVMEQSSYGQYLLRVVDQPY